MARDRRRAKQRRERQARTAGGSVRRDEGRATPAAPAVGPEYTHDPAKPQERASGDVDLADAQLALGRPELIDATQPRPEELAGAATESEVEADEEAFEQLEDRVDAAEEAYEEGASYEEEEAIAAGVPANGHVAEGAEVVRTRRRAPARAKEPGEGNRVVTFLRGSWRELQRVQWPDRRQVGQATAVVVGFVIVAGAFLGLADFVAGKIVDIII
ncbi:MAG TPA: preprotein translocase subunit SecE [Conexibacter sp.]|nr:preprotein translocase subunit SecE [Conexibacter sp.]